MKIQKWLSSMFENRARPCWRELVGQRPHMIEESAADGGFGARDSYAVIDGIALIDISGILVNDSDWWDGWGNSTYGRISGEVRGSAADPEVKAILLRVNSPGGETDLAFETADDILAAAKQKPVWAVADSVAYSAGYLLASAADKLYIAPKSGGVGSIGIYALHMDYSELLAKAGVRPTFIEAGKGKSDGHPYKALSDAAQSKIQAEIDRQYAMFVDHVARQRSMKLDQVRKLGAALFNGADAAISAGLADKAGMFAEAFDALKAKITPKVQSGFTCFAQAGDQTVAAASAANPHKEGTTMPENLLADAQTPAAEAGGVQAPVLPDSRTNQPGSASADAEEITALCGIAGLSAARAHAYISAKKSPKAVQDELLSARAAEAEKTEILSQIQPHSGTATKTDPNESPVVKAAVALANSGTKGGN